MATGTDPDDGSAFRAALSRSIDRYLASVLAPAMEVGVVALAMATPQDAGDPRVRADLARRISRLTRAGRDSVHTLPDGCLLIVAPGQDRVDTTNLAARLVAWLAEAGRRSATAGLAATEVLVACYRSGAGFRDPLISIGSIAAVPSRDASADALPSRRAG